MIRELTLADAVVVCSDMRPEDAACVRAVAGREPGDWFAAERFGTTGPAWVVEHEARPVAICGVSLSCPWVGVLWFIARPGMPLAAWKESVRLARRVIANAAGAGVRRLEAHVLHGWEGAARLVRHVGFALEGIRRGAGANGESIEVWGLLCRPAT